LDAEIEAVLDTQQEIREELSDLIELLDRNEDAWVVTRQVEGLLEELQELQDRTEQMSEQTIGRARGDLNQEERSELDRIAERQRDTSERAEEITDDLRDRSDVLRDSDGQRADALQSAARRAERSELARTMEEAASQIQENRLTNAQQGQAASIETLERMLEDLNEDRRARAEQLIRQLTSLVESIQRLVRVNEDELIALSRLADPDAEEFENQLKNRLNLLFNSCRTQRVLLAKRDRRDPTHPVLHGE